MWKCPKCGRTFKSENQSHYCGKAPETIEEYILSQDEGIREQLHSVRKAIRKELPDAEEKISDSHKKVKDTNVLSFLFKRSVQVLCHYPSDAIWIPMWFFWQRNMKLILSK